MAIGAVACGDDAPGPIVDDGIAWALGCAPGSTACGQYTVHIQSSVDQNFKVTCGRSSSGFGFTIADPGFRGDGLVQPRAPSTLAVTNLDLDRRTCNVSVREASQYGFANETFLGSCSDGSCTIEGAFNKDGWSFVGTLSCSGLAKPVTGPTGMSRYTIYDPSPATFGQPVAIALDNCK